MQNVERAASRVQGSGPWGFEAVMLHHRVTLSQTRSSITVVTIHGQMSFPPKCPTAWSPV